MHDVELASVRGEPVDLKGEGLIVRLLADLVRVGADRADLSLMMRGGQAWQICVRRQMLHFPVCSRKPVQQHPRMGGARDLG